MYKCGKIDHVASRFGLGLTNVNIRKRTFYPLIKFTCQINFRQDENHAKLIIRVDELNRHSMVETP